MAADRPELEGFMIQVYAPNNTNYNKNGDVTLIAEEAYTESELNGSWTATLTHPIDEEGRWKYLTEQAVVKMPSWNGEQLYRIVTRVKDETGVTCTMYPIFFDSMNDCFLVEVKPTDATGQQALNLMLAGSRYSGRSNIQTVKSAVYDYKNFMEALGGEEETSFLKLWGGEVEYDNLTVKVNSHLGTDNGLMMYYGLNIQQISEEIDMTSVVTRVYPRAYNDRPSTTYVDSPIINVYPTARIATMSFNFIKTSGDATEEDENDPNIIICHNQTELDAALTAAVNAEFNNGLDKPVVNISVNGVFDLSKIEGFETWERQPINLGDTVHLVHSKLDITTDARIIYVRYDSIRDEVADIQIGSKPYDFFHTVSDLQASVEAGALDGKDGDQGASVAAVWFEWCQCSSNVIPSGGTIETIRITPWSETKPTYVSGRFYWMRSVTRLTDGTIIYGDPLFDMSSQVAAEAQAAAANAESAASTAQDIADAAKETANEKRRVFLSTPTTPYDRGDLWFDSAHGKTYVCITSKASESYVSTHWKEYIRDVSNYFWADGSGAHVSDTQGTVTSGNSQTIAAGGTVMMRNGKLITSWTGSSSADAAVNFYDCSAATAAAAKLIASYGAAGITLYISGLLAMSLTASGMAVYGVDTVNQTSITEAIFGKNGVELYASGVKRLELSATNGLVFYDVDGSTIVGKFLGSAIELHSLASTRKNDIYFGTNGIRVRSANMSSGLESDSSEVRINNGRVYFYKGGTLYGQITRGTYQNNDVMFITPETGVRVGTDNSNYFVSPTGLGMKAQSALYEETGTFKSETIGTYKTETIGTYKTETIGGNKTANVSGTDKRNANTEVSDYAGSDNYMRIRSDDGLWFKGFAFRWNGYEVFNATGKALKAVADQDGNAIMPKDITVTNLNTGKETGLYHYSAEATGNPASTGGTLLHLRRSSNYAWQMAFVNSASGAMNLFVRMAHPENDSVVWESWKKVSMS